MENLWVVSEKLKPFPWGLVGVVNVLAFACCKSCLLDNDLTETSIKISAQLYFKGRKFQLPTEKN